MIQALPPELARRVFPPLRTPRVRRTNLPTPLTSFIGRHDELADLSRRLEEGARLITLLGTGGTGKTRLAQRLGRSRIDEQEGGVWFCDLTDARSTEDVAGAVAAALGGGLGPGDPTAQVAEMLRDRGQSLMILDNFEQVVDAAGRTVGAWTTASPQTRFLVTSRTALHLAGEQVVRVSPLAVPTTGPTSLDSLLATPAGVLFVERATSASGELDLHHDEVDAIAGIVRRLDGLPLAIELAAVRVRTMAPTELLIRLEDRLDFLRGGRGALGHRQATLRSTIDWSWDLLEPWAQAAFAQCSVFEGGFTLDAAEAVIDLSAWPDAPMAMDALESIVDQSLVWLDTRGRFGMYVTLRDYASEKLGDHRAAAEQRHGDYFADVHEPKELGNIIAACRRAIARRQPALALCTVQIAQAIYTRLGPLQAAIPLLDGVLAITISDTDRLQLLLDRGALHQALSHRELALADLDAAETLARALGDDHAVGRATLRRAVSWHDAKEMRRAEQEYEHARALFEAAGDQRGLGRVLNSLGHLYREEGAYDRAAASYDGALSLARSADNRGAEAAALGSMALLDHELGRFDEGLEHLESALSWCEQAGDHNWQSVHLSNLGLLQRDTGRLDAARTTLKRAISQQRELGMRRLLGLSAYYLGTVELRAGRLDAAERWLDEAIETCHRVDAPEGEGAARSARAELWWRRGSRDAAAAELDIAAALLDRAGTVADTVELLCRRARLLDDGDALEEAARTVAALSLGPEAPLAAVVAATRAQQ
jgi:predicted ATPase